MRDAKDHTLAVSLAGLSRAQSPRSWMEWAAEAGFRGVAIDAAAQGVRPRELDRSARRDLAAVLRRLDLCFVGLDLWIPPAHFVDPTRADLAIGSTHAALRLAGEIAGLIPGSSPIVSVTLPDEPPDSLTAAIAEEARSAGARLADTRVNAVTGDSRDADPAFTDVIGAGLDPAAVLLAGSDPTVALVSAGDRLVMLRLSDADHAGRTAVGAGRLDVRALAAAAVVHRRSAPLVLDVRGLTDPDAAARAAFDAWAAVSVTP